MNRRNKILAIIILTSGALVASAFAIQVPRKTAVETPTPAPTTAPAADTAPVSVTPHENLTDTLIRTYAEEIAQRNQDGLKTNEKGTTGISFPDKQAIEDLVTEKLKAGFTVQLATMSDVRTTDDTSNDAARAYLAGIQRISDARFPGGPVNDLQTIGPWITDRNAANLFQASDAMDKFVADLKSLPAPRSWSDFHLAFVNLQVKRLAIYRALLAMEDDPLQATLAADLIDKLATAESEVQELFAEHAAAISS